MFCYQKNFSNPTLPVDEAQFYALVRAGKWNEAIDQYRKTGEASLKRKLPAFIFQATFDETESAKGKNGQWRKQAATRLTVIRLKGDTTCVLIHIQNTLDILAIQQQLQQLNGVQNKNILLHKRFEFVSVRRKRSF